MPSSFRFRLRGTRWLAAAAICCASLVAAVVYHVVYAHGLDTLTQLGRHRAELFSAGLKSSIARYDYLPTLLALDPEVARLLREPHDPAQVDRLNRYLARINAEAQSSALYVIAANGTTLAASNWNQPSSYVGSNYAFRPYFRDALAGGTGHFYAVGATTREPGYFLAKPVRDAGRLVGVVAVKIDLAALERTWRQSAEKVMVSDDNGIIALAADPAWKFAALDELDARQRARLTSTRQYYTSPLPRLSVVWHDDDQLALDGHRYLGNTTPLPILDWRMRILLDLQPLKTTAGLAGLASALACWVVMLLVLYARQRTRRLRERLAARDALERTVTERTAELAEANAQLTREIAERRDTEARLRVTQHDLVQTSRLAALGQMAAGLAHELNQPLAALATYAGNTRQLLARGQRDLAEDNLDQIAALVERMARLTSQLKLYASRRRAEGSGAGTARPDQALDHVRHWMDARFARAGATLITAMPPHAPLLPLEPAALEQVLQNLLANALDAMPPDALRREVRVSAGEDDSGRRWLEVRDSGTGIASELIDRITEPFFSTKPLGQGLGLGLAIVRGLIEDSGGRLGIANADDGGASIMAVWPPSAAPTGEPA